MAKKTPKKKEKKNIQTGVAHIQASFNNTIVTLTDVGGNVIVWCSAGSEGFKGSRKSTPFAAQKAAESGAGEGMERGLIGGAVRHPGPGAGIESAIRALQA